MQAEEEAVEEYQLSTVKIADLKLDPSNPNKPTKEQIEGIRKSIREFGFVKPLVINEKMEIADGEHRALVMKALGRTEIQAYIVPRINDDIKRRLARQTLNKLQGEHDIKLDADEMALIFEAGQLNNLAELIAQGRESLENILTKHKGIQFQHEDGFDVDKALEDLVPTTQLGDIWQLGQHRIICADCTDKQSIDRFLENTQLDIILTDPPYSSGGFQEAQRGTGSIGTRQNASIRNDVLSTRGYMSLMSDAIVNLKAEILYLFTDWRMWINAFDISERCGFGVRNMIVWDKGTFGMGFPWRSQHELILYGRRSPSPNMGEGNRGNVLQAKRTGNINHPTEKPISLLVQLLENSEGNNVIDPFLGSGSTMIACEQTNRICYGVEIDPHYVDVCCKRWEAYTGAKAVLLPREEVIGN